MFLKTFIILSLYLNSNEIHFISITARTISSTEIFLSRAYGGTFHLKLSKDQIYASILGEYSNVKFLYKNNQTRRKVHRNKHRNLLLLHRIHLFPLESCREAQPILGLLLYLSKEVLQIIKMYYEYDFILKTKYGNVLKR